MYSIDLVDRTRRLIYFTGIVRKCGRGKNIVLDRQDNRHDNRIENLIKERYEFFQKIKHPIQHISFSLYIKNIFKSENSDMPNTANLNEKSQEALKQLTFTIKNVFTHPCYNNSKESIHPFQVLIKQ